MILQEC